jgi:hypothetical protein
MAEELKGVAETLARNARSLQLYVIRRGGTAGAEAS